MGWRLGKHILRAARKEITRSGVLDPSARGAYTSGMSIGTRLFTRFRGRSIGTDSVGNIYYEERKPRAGARGRRWVMFAGAPEASTVPPEWHSWLHFTTDAPLPDTGRRPWQKPHEPNLTGTPLGYRPPGHDYQGGHRAASTGDYEAWTPDA
jgi:NADH:ubiquinone oxidoreductase subunit